MTIRRRERKSAKKSVSSKKNGDGDIMPLDEKGQACQDHEVDRQCAAIRALRDIEIAQLQTMLRLLRSYFNTEELKVPVLKFFRENFPNLSIVVSGKDGQYGVRWRDKDGNSSLHEADERSMHTSLLQRLSLAYPGCSTGVLSLGGFDFSNKSVKTGLFGADKLQIRSFALDEPSHSQVFELKDSLQTPDLSNNMISTGMTPKTLRLPKHGEMLLSVHGSPLGVHKEDNMETIQARHMFSCHEQNHLQTFEHKYDTAIRSNLSRVS